MTSSKYSSRRHVPQRPPICNPPLKRIQFIPPPPWPPQKLRAVATIKNNNDQKQLDATISPTYPSPETNNYYANQNGITINFRVEILQRRLYVDYMYAIVGGQYVYATQSWREINPATPINETYPPWTTKVPGTATAELEITTA